MSWLHALRAGLVPSALAVQSPDGQREHNTLLQKRLSLRSSKASSPLSETPGVVAFPGRRNFSVRLQRSGIAMLLLCHDLPEFGVHGV
ncbi:hypothetical protein N0K08_10430 [Acidovorax sp. Be4]|uniref:Secreted protein n=1 Tax=Acidovorax bellezanensis TaxID=2976702 RepID=A0ABT2PKN8_9BURK|nr:hypothetical protein [Acidovorax sp. Be4]MCT9811050.1 hypothetical protein [Acidovorax sp. Be4]